MFRCYESSDSFRTLSDLQCAPPPSRLAFTQLTITCLGCSLTRRLPCASPTSTLPSTGDEDLALLSRSEFVVGFVNRLAALDGPNSYPIVFCRVNLSVFVDEHKNVSFYVNEVKRGLIPCLSSLARPSMVGRVESGLVCPLACWISKVKRRLGIC